MEGKQQIVDIQVHWKQNFEELLKQLKHSSIDYQNIETLIETTFRFYKREDIIRTLQEQLGNFYRINPSLFFDYLSVPVTFLIDDINLDSPTYKKVLENINKIKMKYGIYLRNLINSSREPFSILGVETSVLHNETSHTIRFLRADGASLEGTFKSAGLMAIIASLTETLKMSMERGIYNIDKGVIDLYITKHNEFMEILNKIISETKDE